ncbi:SPOR domain-containing protein [Endozoicomonas sp. Mp262]|uniref:SPOR domain-containing protein n=1 Tax=Endozoicomonas sp. Mp262 TaxID=2919499 RepID=UPI0021DA6CAA
MPSGALFKDKQLRLCVVTTLATGTVVYPAEALLLPPKPLAFSSTWDCRSDSDNEWLCRNRSDLGYSASLESVAHDSRRQPSTNPGASSGYNSAFVAVPAVAPGTDYYPEYPESTPYNELSFNSPVTDSAILLELLNAPPDSYVLQWLAANSREPLENLKSRYPVLQEATIAEYQRAGKQWFILLDGPYPSRIAAMAALKREPRSAIADRFYPWTRSVASIQQLDLMRPDQLISGRTDSGSSPGERQLPYSSYNSSYNTRPAFSGDGHYQQPNPNPDPAMRQPAPAHYDNPANYHNPNSHYMPGYDNHRPQSQQRFESSFINEQGFEKPNPDYPIAYNQPYPHSSVNNVTPGESNKPPFNSRGRTLSGANSYHQSQGFPVRKAPQSYYPEPQPLENPGSYSGYYQEPVNPPAQPSGQYQRLPDGRPMNLATASTAPQGYIPAQPNQNREPQPFHGHNNGRFSVPRQRYQETLPGAGAPDFNHQPSEYSDYGYNPDFYRQNPQPEPTYNDPFTGRQAPVHNSRKNSESFNPPPGSYTIQWLAANNRNTLERLKLRYPILQNTRILRYQTGSSDRYILVGGTFNSQEAAQKALSLPPFSRLTTRLYPWVRPAEGIQQMIASSHSKRSSKPLAAAYSKPLQRIITNPDSRYTIQWYAANRPEAIQRMKQRFPQLSNAVTVHYRRNQRDWYVLLQGQFSSSQEATSAIKSPAMRDAARILHPWTRPINSLKRLNLREQS